MTTPSAPDTHRPAATEELPARARALRRAGLSTAQIARELEVPHNGTLSGWLRGVPPPDWTRRPGAKDDVRRRARELRASGKTYEEIAIELGVSKSTCSLWLRDMAGGKGPASRPAVRTDQGRHVDDEDLRLRATELRGRGMTLRQVRRDLGIGVDQLTRILLGGPRIDLRRERDKSEELRRMAKLLRSRGSSYQQIAMELGLASSTVGVWCRDVDDAVTGRSGQERRTESVRRAAHLREAQRQQALLEGAREIGHLGDRELMLLG